MPYECKTTEEPKTDNPDFVGMVDLAANAQLTVYQTFRVMKNMEFDEPLPWTDDSLYDWLRDAVGGVHFASTGMSYCCKEGRVIVIAVGDLEHPLTRTQGAPRGLIRVMAHEARHAEGFPHTCGTDDETFGELGAWALHHYVDLWVAEHSIPGLFSQREKDDAAIDAESTINLNICRYGLEFVDDQNGWVSGGWGRILKTDDGGTSWSAEGSSIRGHVNALSFADELRGWAVDREGGILHTNDGGITWNPQVLPKDFPAMPRDILDIAALDATTGWTFGSIDYPFIQ